MKVRSGFVSNSSTSSFLIYGAFIEGKTYDEVDEILEGVEGLEWHSPDYSDGVYVGRSWDSIGDDETGKQFKDGITKVLKEKFGPEIETSSFEEAWHA